MTMGLWAIPCFVLFLITFLTSRERIHPDPKQKSTPKQDLGDLLGNGIQGIIQPYTDSEGNTIPGLAIYTDHFPSNWELSTERAVEAL